MPLLMCNSMPKHVAKDTGYVSLKYMAMPLLMCNSMPKHVAYWTNKIQLLRFVKPPLVDSFTVTFSRLPAAKASLNFPEGHSSEKKNMHTDTKMTATAGM